MFGKQEKEEFFCEFKRNVYKPPDLRSSLLDSTARMLTTCRILPPKSWNRREKSTKVSQHSKQTSGMHLSHELYPLAILARSLQLEGSERSFGTLRQLRLRFKSCRDRLLKKKVKERFSVTDQSSHMTSGRGVTCPQTLQKTPFLWTRSKTRGPSPPPWWQGQNCMTNQQPKPRPKTTIV